MNVIFNTKYLLNTSYNSIQVLCYVPLWNLYFNKYEVVIVNQIINKK